MTSRRLFTVLFAIIVLTAIHAHALPVEDIASLSVQIPYGLKEGKGLAVQNSSFQAFFSVESFYQGDLDVDLKIKFPEGFEIQEPNEYSFKLQTEYDNWYKFIKINIPESTSPGIYSIKTIANISAGSESFHIERESLVRVVSAYELSQIIKINKVIIPSSEEGEETQYQENSLVLKEKSRLLKKLSGGKEHFSPIAYAGIEVENTGEENAVLLVSFEILDANKNFVPGFERPSMGGDQKLNFVPVNMKASSKEIITLPVYASEDIVLGGDYISRSTVKVFGSDFPASVKENPVKVIARNWTSIYITLFALILSISAFSLFMIKHKQIFENFKTKYLVMISLFGTVAFATINVPMAFLWEISHAIFGPFSSLFTGVFYEIVWYAIIVSLLILIPRIGVISILIIVRFILSGVIFGHFSPVIMISYGFQAVALEAALYLTGITRGIKIEDRKISLSINLGMADVLSSYVSFNLFMFMYRLFYADWYIIMNLTISGFIYTFIGVLLGITLGKKLKKVVD
ncbi:MAG: hypothetical protein V1854_02585 [Methanobacteriota archaeon]